MIRRWTEDDVRDLARRFRLTLPEELVGEYRDLGNDLLAVVEEADDAHAASERAAAPPPGTRRDEGPASREQDPLNAVTRWIDVAAPGATGPLAGRRIAVKDSIAIAGMPMTCGSHLLRDYVPSRDSVVTERLLAAGARLVAVTSMDDLAFSGGGDTGAQGPVRNPFDPARTSGGSSGGSAACLWYEEIDAAIGTDQGGSIRVPAAWCGVVGLKPTHGLVPYTGIPGIDQTIDHAGPLARTVTAAAELLSVLAGPHQEDPRQRAGSIPQDYTAAVAGLDGDLRGLTFGLVRESISDDVGIDPLVAKAVHAVAEEMRRRGAQVVPVGLPAHLTAGGIAYATFLEGTPPLLRAGGNGYQWRGRYSPDLATAVRRGLRESADDLSPQVKITLMLGSYLQEQYGGAVYARAQNLRPALATAYDDALSTVDALLLPTTPGLPFALDPPVSPGENVQRGWALLANTIPTDLTGHPAISLPLAEADGLPVGVMLVGRRFEDAELLRAAARCEAVLGRRPLTGPVVPSREARA